MRVGAIIVIVVMVSTAFAVYYGLDRVPDQYIPEFLKRRPAEVQQPVVVAPPVAKTAEIAVPVASEPVEPEPAETAMEEIAEEPPVPAEEAPVVVDAEPEPEPEPAPAPPPPPKKTTVAKAPAPAPSSPPREPVKSKPPSADLITQWWPDPASMPEKQLKLVYAGQVQQELALALLFSSAVNMDTLKAHSEVRTDAGERVSATWEAGKNPRLAVMRTLAPGRYTVVLNPPIADTQGYLLGTTLQGPVYIQAP